MHSTTHLRIARRAALGLLLAFAATACQSTHRASPATAAQVSPGDRPIDPSPRTWNYLGAASVKQFTRVFVAPPTLSPAEPAQDFETRLVWEVGRMATDTATRNARDAADDSLWKFRPAMGQNFTPENCKKIEIFLTKAAIDANNIKTDLKDSFQRARPVPRPGATDERDGDFSFPSGHATRAGLRYRLLSAIAPDREVDLLKEGWLMCMDRMIVGMHYPTDITAGFVLGERIADEILKAAAEDPGSACAGDLRGAMEEWRGVSR